MTLDEIFNAKLTENGDIAFKKASDNPLLNILFLTEYYQKHLDEIPTLEDSNINRLFAMFIRDPRLGLGRRDLGRKLMSMTDVPIEYIIKAGRVDDLLSSATWASSIPSAVTSRLPFATAITHEFY